MEKISAFIIAKNEEINIAKAINSLKDVASEIILIDSGSTDQTCIIAEKLGCRIVYNEWDGYLKQKQYGESLCANKWILNIDADEELSPKLQDEIRAIARSKYINKYKAYTLNTLILHRNDDKPRFLAPNNRVVRLYNIDHAGFKYNNGDSTHDSVKFKDAINTKKEIFNLIGDMHHRSGTSIEQLMRKANFYSTEQADALHRKNREISNLRLVLEFPIYLFKTFIIRRYFVFGIDGFVDSMVFSFARFARIAKLRDLKQNPKK